jgi:hypothetical protein
MSNVQYINGQYYENPYSNDPIRNAIFAQEVKLGYVKPIGAPTSSSNNTNNVNNSQNPFFNPFGTAQSGGVAGTLQPYINRNTSLANNALYGGLLGYQPQQLKAGDAGGTPVNPTPPQWKLPSAIPTANQAQVGLLGPQAANYNNPQPGIFGNRAWMEY